MNNTLFGKLEDIAIERLKEFEPSEGYYLAFSGGKDSVVIKQLAIDSGVKFDAHYSLTTIDPPELVRFIKQHHSDVIIDRPKEPYLKALVRKGFPLRQSRWCCELYKEGGGAGRTVITGIRWEESSKRSKRRMYEVCKQSSIKKYLHTIIEWTESDVWNYIKEKSLPYCCLYDEGFTRIGCLFCPIARAEHRVEEAKRYPKMKNAFVKAFQKLKDDRDGRGKESCKRWSSGEEMFNWYINEIEEEPDDCGPMLW